MWAFGLAGRPHTFRTFMGTFTKTAVPKAGPIELTLWLLRRRRRYRVTGESMYPTLSAGDVVFVNTRAPINENEIVCARHPHDPSIVVIKRVGFTDEDDQLFLLSDNPHAPDSADSNRFGRLSPDRVEGVVTSILQ